jgi:hypothetical protein
MKDFSEVLALFEVYSQCVETRASVRDYYPDRYDHEPTRDHAAQWLDATPEERERMRARFNAMLVAKRAEDARDIVPREVRRARSLEASRVSSRNWKRKHPQEAREALRRWREANPDGPKRHARKHRVKVKANAEAYRKERDADNARRKRARDARKRELLARDPGYFERIEQEKCERLRAMAEARRKHASKADREKARNRRRLPRAQMSEAQREHLRALDRETKRRKRAKAKL